MKTAVGLSDDLPRIELYKRLMTDVNELANASSGCLNGAFVDGYRTFHFQCLRRMKKANQDLNTVMRQIEALMNEDDARDLS